jgi:putative endonuclease
MAAPERERRLYRPLRCKRLVWYELHGDMRAAIGREKQIKGGPRVKKLALIEAQNPDWADLFDGIV